MKRYRYIVEFGAGMAAYAVVLSISVLFVNQLEGFWKTALSLAPMVPALAVAVSIMRQIRRIDELQRQIQLEALSLAFGGTALISFSYGFLENAGYPKLSMFVVWPLMAILWIIGGLISHRRFR
ncbi:putative membrane protein [Sinorhizobium sp. RAC02]|nr:putative membrane protein [Sinorhizobium sp. RAC02]